ncbi:endonuclease III [Candidatus Bathyarchaeota archaeon]|nr:endonuclease III [Candidatus Bathyarchaeota archaeon]
MEQRVNAILKALIENYPELTTEPQRHDPFRTLIGCILSQRTRDLNSEKAGDNLFGTASTLEEVAELDEDTLHELIRCSGFYRQKARHITGTCRALLERHGGEVPETREELLTLPGVGPKTADIVLAYGFGDPAIPVDVHVSRVSRRLGLTPQDANPEEVQKSLHNIIPRAHWTFYDRSIVRLGKEYCRKTNPRCGACPLKESCEYRKKSAKGD